MSAPLVSIVIPCFNAARWIGAAIASCLQQTYRPLEIIVVDDGSDDESRAVVARAAAATGPALRTLVQARQGPAAARNRGLAAARGEYIQWLDADDLLEPDKIRPQVELLAARPGVDGVYGDWKERAQLSRFTGALDQRRTAPRDDFLLAYTSGQWVAVHAFLIRRSLAERYAWDTTLAALEDHDYWLQQALRGGRLAYLRTDACAVYRMQPGAATRNQMTATWRQARLQLHRKTQASLAAYGLLACPRYRQAMAAAYVGLAWRCQIHRDPTLARAALAHAYELAAPAVLRQASWPFPVLPGMDLERSMAWHGRWVRAKAIVKDRLYRWCAFDPQTSWRDNLRRRLIPATPRAREPVPQTSLR